MGLEETLARIQVKSKEIAHRSYQGHIEGLDVDWVKIGGHSKGISHDAEIVYDAYSRVSKARENEEASRYVGELALSLKNLADNVNGLLQSIYNPNDRQVSHKDIEMIASKSPMVDDSTSALDLFLATHNYDSDVVEMRNKFSHGFGHSLVNEGFTIEQMNAWSSSKTAAYLNMADSILEAVASHENHQLSAREGYKGKSIFRQKLDNWRKRHQKTFAIAASAALAGAGVLGTIGFQKITSKDREVYEGNQIRNLISAAQVSNTDNWALRLDKSRYNDVLDEITTRGKDSGVWVDNYMTTLRGISNNRVNPEIEEAYAFFNSRRKSFRDDLLKTKKKIKDGSYRNQIEIISEISDLLTYERWLSEEEDNLNKRLGYVRPLPSSMLPIDYTIKGNK